MDIGKDHAQDEVFITIPLDEECKEDRPVPEDIACQPQIKLGCRDSGIQLVTKYDDVFDMEDDDVSDMQDETVHYVSEVEDATDTIPRNRSRLSRKSSVPCRRCIKNDEEVAFLHTVILFLIIAVCLLLLVIFCLRQEK